MKTTGTTDMRGFKIFLGDCLQGRVFRPWVIGTHYDWEYRLEWIKSNSDYTEFYLMCPLEGPRPIGKTLREALDRIDLEHAHEYKEDLEDEILNIETKVKFTYDEIPF